MNRSARAAAFSLLCSCSFPSIAPAQALGPLVVVGGGATNDAVVARMMEMAGGKNAVVAVLPQSSALADAGDSSVAMYRKLGAM
jgi:hypothetical protein